jgi:4'-phosphopantetheinyl transferase
VRRGDVRLWLVDTERAPPDVAGTLSPAERRRAARIVVPARAREFAATRAALRTILARELGIAPGEVRLRDRQRGKPALDSAHAADLRFNVSHTRGLSLVALAPGRDVGVDVERVDPGRAVDGLIRTQLTARERRSLGELHGRARRRTFFALWTAKEAALKADGTGIAMPLSAVEAPVGEGRVHIVGGVAPRSWRIRRPRVPAGVSAAVVAGGDDWEVTLR